MSTTFQSINRFAVLNNVEPGSTSSKKESRVSSGLETTTTSTSTTSKSKNKSKTVNGSAIQHTNGSSSKGKQRPRSSALKGLSNPIVADSTTLKPKSDSTSTPATPSTNKQQPRTPALKNTSARLRSNLSNDASKPMTRPAVVSKRGEGAKIVSKKTDWEIPRKTLHGSIGFLVLYLHASHPPTLTPLLLTLSLALLIITLTDILRTHSRPLNLIYIKIFGGMMRKSEERGWNGVIWYLMGCIWTLGVYPRDVAVVSVLTLSWSDTAASTLGRFLGALLTGTCIGLYFWSNGKHSDAGYGQLWGANQDLSGWAGERAGSWEFLGRSWGRWSTALVLGVGGAVVEALDLGYDDNLTLPILTGAIVWVWLTVVSWLTTSI